MTDTENDDSAGQGKPAADPHAGPNPQNHPPKKDPKEHGVLYIGMDLGTSRTSISSSNGVRECIFSVVGYPKDHVAQKLLNRDVLVGKEAVEKRLSLDFHRPLEHGVLRNGDPKSSKAAADLIRAAIDLARPRKDELIYAVIGAPAQASINNKEAIIEAARESVDSVMLCSEPFSVAYGLDMLEDVLVIDIGAGTIDLCRMHGTMPEDSDQITLQIAGDAIDQELSRLIVEHCPGAQFSVQMVKDIKERHSFLGEPQERVMVSLPVDGKPTQFDLTEQMKAACNIIVDPIVEGLRQLVASFDPEFQGKLRDRVLLAGGGSQISGLDSAIEQRMIEHLGGGKVIRVEEPIYGGSNGALKIAHDMPEKFWEDLR
jgi:rod shape-determining protein MreB and related proteins